ncbi:hypothetical protein B296_00046570 [Ensete ventricosum]|uniref:Uncharacterized protein n=1 Tax=Ensete ventricosum TaxID=4639 RepID=A0A426XFE7_ENSVE|nr:hypothetical protein B296_00046570 [Ensete ventricosum]
MKHGAEARSFPLTKVKDMNSCRGKIVPWVLYSDGADSSCMVPKTKGASKHMHLVLEMHLMKKLSKECNIGRYVSICQLIDLRTARYRAVSSIGAVSAYYHRNRLKKREKKKREKKNLDRPLPALFVACGRRIARAILPAYAIRCLRAKTCPCD